MKQVRGKKGDAGGGGGGQSTLYKWSYCVKRCYTDITITSHSKWTCPVHKRPVKRSPDQLLSSAQETCKKKSRSTELNKIHNLVNCMFLQPTKLEPTNSTTACLLNTPHPELNSSHSTSDISCLVALWSKCLPSYNAITKKGKKLTFLFSHLALFFFSYYF